MSREICVQRLHFKAVVGTANMLGGVTTLSLLTALSDAKKAFFSPQKQLTMTGCRRGKAFLPEFILSQMNEFRSGFDHVHGSFVVQKINPASRREE